MGKKIVSYLMVMLIALMMALNYQLFVFPNSFAPAGLNGIFTMIQHVLGFKLSYTSIILNVPLAIIVFFVIAKPFALRSLLYTLAFSGFLMVFDAIDLSAFVYNTELSKLVADFPGSFVTFSHVNSVLGNFKHLDSRNEPEKTLYDSGKK